MHRKFVLLLWLNMIKWWYFGFFSCFFDKTCRGVLGLGRFIVKGRSYFIFFQYKSIQQLYNFTLLYLPTVLLIWRKKIMFSNNLLTMVHQQHTWLVYKLTILLLLQDLVSLQQINVHVLLFEVKKKNLIVFFSSCICVCLCVLFVNS